MKVSIFILGLASLLIFSACKPESEKEMIGNTKADSLLSQINSPELLSLNKKILDNPNDPELYNQRAKLYLSFKQLDEALGDAKRAINLDSTKADYFLTAADVYFAHNNTRQAKDLLERITIKFPTNTDGLLKLGELYFFVKQYEKAFEKINAALKINENIAKAYYLKGSIYKELGDTNKAVSSMETAVEQDNQYYNAFMDLGIMYAARHNALALEYYNNAIRVSPNNPDALYAKAMFLQEEEKYDEAQTIYEGIVKSIPNHEHSLFNMGAIAFHVKKDPKKAMDYFTKAINANPKYGEAYYARGACYEELGDKANATADYNMCLQLIPNYLPAVEGMQSVTKMK